MNDQPSSESAVNVQIASSSIPLCLSFPDTASLLAKLNQIVGAAGPIDRRSVAPENGIVAATSHHAVLVGAGDTELQAAAADLIAAIGRDPRCGVADRAVACHWQSESIGDRVAWLFPGQGSQYAGHPAIWKCDPTAAAYLKSFDELLRTQGIDPVSDRLHDPDGRLGKDIWWTQLWILAVSGMLADSLRRVGLRPDVLAGHSFGECGAAWFAGAMDGSTAIRFAKQRSDAVIATVRGGGQLLSIKATASEVASIIDADELDVVITHCNAPQQTVVAGSAEAIAQARRSLSSASIAAVVIPVPAAFHTPSMEPAQQILSRTFAGLRMRPPSTTLLSATTLRYLAEPDEVRDNLVQQLTRPVLFAATLRRLIDDGCGLLIEVGPGDVLTRLARQTVQSGDRHAAIALSLDAGPDHDRQLALIEAVCGMIRRSPATSAASIRLEAFAPDASQERTADPKPVNRQGTSGQTSNGQASNGQASNGHSSNRQGVFASPAVMPSHRSASAPRSNPQGGRRSVIVADNLSGPGTAEVTDPVEVMDVTSFRSSPTRTARSSAAAVSIAQPVTQAFIDPVAQVAQVAPSDESMVASSGEVESFLVDLIVELTGYEPEVIEFDADLEAELGIDSIKKAQVIGELAQWASLSLDLHSMKLADFVTLADIAALCQPAIPAATSRPSGTGSISESIQSLMIDFVVDQTGYDVDIIDMDADLEAELGVDSIKKAQLMGELQEQFDLSDIRLDQLKLSDFQTLSAIKRFVLRHLAVDPDDEVIAGEKKNATSDQCHDVEVSPGCDLPEDTAADEPPAPATGTSRFVLRCVDAAQRDGMPELPTFRGDALIVGDNPVARAITSRLQTLGVRVHQIATSVSITAIDLDAELDRIWSTSETPHLFLTTPWDQDAMTTPVSSHWRMRHEAAWKLPFRVAQRWMTRMIDRGVMDEASLISVVRGGGSLGFQPHASASLESGGIAGMTKAMAIEAWMRGIRQTSMRIVDVQPDVGLSRLVDGILQELAVPSYDGEVVITDQGRRAGLAIHRPLPDATDPPVTSRIDAGGSWVVSGGGRGITALTAMTLAQRHRLRLHLLGTAPVPEIDDATAAAAIDDRSELRRRAMRSAQSRGENPIVMWRDLGKAIEIDQTLRECRKLGIAATYHSVDVSDAAAVREVIDRIRRSDGPIRGVIHGAGAGQDARFDRKRPDKVAQCVGAKVDGAIHLADATRQDPLQWFVGFGSISGRFGANGHTDYSLANDMLAKTVTALKHQRPEVRCVTFHWHAWGDIGMAAKPESKLALEMIGMQFMPADEGLRHFINELEHGGDETEVLITDRRYVRKFYPTRLMRSASRRGSGWPRSLPLLDPNHSGLDASDVRSVTLDPVADTFLCEHLIGGRPTLPMVVAIELIAQAGLSTAPAGHTVSRIRDVTALQPLKFATPDPVAVELVRTATTGVESTWQLCADLRRSDGRMVQQRRVHFQGTVVCGPPQNDASPRHRPMTEDQLDWQPIEYLGPDAPIHHGPSLQTLTRIAIQADATTCTGEIAAPSPAALMGEHRPLNGWSVPCAVMDGCLYAAALLAYRNQTRGSLPVGFQSIGIGRIADPGEPLRIRWQIRGLTNRGVILDGQLSGLNGDAILTMEGYELAWLSL